MNVPFCSFRAPGRARCARSIWLGLLLVTATVLAPAGAQGKVYKWVAEDGRIMYSDEPPPQGASELDLLPLQTYDSPGSAPRPLAREKPAARKDAGSYERFEVIDPANDVTIWDNSGRLSVDLAIQPALRSGHVVEILLDGGPLGTGRSTRLSLVNVDRGTHSVQGVIKDEAGKELARTASVTFHLRRQSIVDRDRRADFKRAPSAPAAPAPDVPGGANTDTGGGDPQ